MWCFRNIENNILIATPYLCYCFLSSLGLKGPSQESPDYIIILDFFEFLKEFQVKVGDNPKSSIWEFRKPSKGSHMIKCMNQTENLEETFQCRKQDV